MLPISELIHPQKIFFILLVATFSLPIFGAPAALLTGAVFSLFWGNLWPKPTANRSKKLLKIAVVGLGFGLSLSEVWVTGKGAIPWTFSGIVMTMAAGHLLGQWFATSSGVRVLVSFGTAICGGSAIAAMAPIIKSKNEETAAALATIFMLNSGALLLFPVIGHAIDLVRRNSGSGPPSPSMIRAVLSGRLQLMAARRWLSEQPSNWLVLSGSYLALSASLGP
jgi:uncharacterized membrane protein YadS